MIEQRLNGITSAKAAVDFFVELAERLALHPDIDRAVATNERVGYLWHYCGHQERVLAQAADEWSFV